MICINSMDRFRHGRRLPVVPARQLKSGKWTLISTLHAHRGGILERTIVRIGTPNVTGIDHKTERFVYRGEELNCGQIVMEIYEDGHSYISVNDSKKTYKHSLTRSPRKNGNKIALGRSIILYFPTLAKANNVYKSFKLDEQGK